MYMQIKPIKKCNHSEYAVWNRFVLRVDLNRRKVESREKSKCYGCLVGSSRVDEQGS